MFEVHILVLCWLIDIATVPNPVVRSAIPAPHSAGSWMIDLVQLRMIFPSYNDRMRLGSKIGTGKTVHRSKSSGWLRHSYGYKCGFPMTSKRPCMFVPQDIKLVSLRDVEEEINGLIKKEMKLI